MLNYTCISYNFVFSRGYSRQLCSVPQASFDVKRWQCWCFLEKIIFTIQSVTPSNTFISRSIHCYQLCTLFAYFGHSVNILEAFSSLLEDIVPSSASDNFIEPCNLIWVVTFPAHVQTHTLNSIITLKHSTHICEITSGGFIKDHECIVAQLNSNRGKTPHGPLINIRKCDKINKTPMQRLKKHTFD